VAVDSVFELLLRLEQPICLTGFCSLRLQSQDSCQLGDLEFQTLLLCHEVIFSCYQGIELIYILSGHFLHIYSCFYEYKNMRITTRTTMVFKILVIIFTFVIIVMSIINWYLFRNYFRYYRFWRRRLNHCLILSSSLFFGCDFSNFPAYL